MREQAQLIDDMNQMVEVVDAYRSVCIQHGYSETAAERMAMDYHAQLVARVFEEMKG
jgi:hypothetical protein